METNSSWTGFYWWVGLVNKLLFSVKELMPGLSLEQLKSQMHTNPKCSMFHWRTTSIIVPFTSRRTDCWFCNQLFTEMFVLVVSKSWSFPVISSSNSLIIPLNSLQDTDLRLLHDAVQWFPQTVTYTIPTSFPDSLFNQKFVCSLPKWDVADDIRPTDQRYIVWTIVYKYLLFFIMVFVTERGRRKPVPSFF